MLEEFRLQAIPPRGIRLWPPCWRSFLLLSFCRFLRVMRRIWPFLVPIEPLAVWLSGIEPIGWTVNLISLLWVWLIFIGCAFAISEKDHVVFDVFVQAMPPRLRLILRAVVCVIRGLCHGVRLLAHMGGGVRQPS